MRHRYFSLGLAAAVAVHALLAWISLRPRGPGHRALWGDEMTYLGAAKRIANGESSGLDLLWPPGYPHFLAPLVDLGGDSLIPVFIAQTLLLIATAWLLRDALARLTGPGLAPDLLGLLVLAFPPLAAYCYYLWPEVPHLALTAAAVWILVARRRDLRWLVVLGITLGLILTLKSLLGPFLPVLLIPLFVGVSWWRGLGRSLVVLLALGSVVGPIAWSNWQREGVFTVANSSRFNVWVGLNTVSTKNFVDDPTGALYEDYLMNGPTFAHRNRILGEQIDRYVEEHGVGPILGRQLRRQYFRLFDKDSNLTDQLPGGILAERGFGYRKPPPFAAGTLRYGSYLLYLSLLVLAVAGIVIHPPWQAQRLPGSNASGQRFGSWLWLPTLFVLYNLAVFLLLHVKSRYRIALLPVIFLFAALAVQWFVDRRGGGDSLREPLPPPSRRAIAWGTGLAILLLFLALAGRLWMR